MKILVVSDTHGEMPIDIKKMDFDAVMHAGDIGDAAFFGALNATAGEKNLYAVSGNTDFVLSGYLPENVSTNMGGLNFFMVHNLTAPHRILPANESAMNAAKAEIVVFGHTHTPLAEERGGRIFINPGSLGKAGLTGRRSFAVMETEPSGTVKIQIYDIDSKEVFILKKFNKFNGLFREI
ncbi:metallophosphoesterase family protein [bacterium]|nr:metallophosphoesterase family protein [bacterium]